VLANKKHSINILHVENTLQESGPLTCLEFSGSIAFLTDEPGTSLYLVNKSEGKVAIGERTELFGFGNGAWAIAKDAEDTIN
jgi:hypothetical protein